MGCDIHPRLQVKPEYHGEWKTVAVPSDGRWYLFFELLVGVRQRHGFAGVMPALRGLPNPLGRTSDYDCERRDSIGDHSQTWWTLAEMKAALPQAEAFCGSITEPPADWGGATLDRFKAWIALGDMMRDAHEATSDDDVRFVVGFDN